MGGGDDVTKGLFDLAPGGPPVRARPGNRQHRSQTIDCEAVNSIGHLLQHSSEGQA